MKYHINLSIYLLHSLLFLTTCDDEVDLPNAEFLPIEELKDVGQSIAFSNASTHSAIYTWNFGDGSTSNVENPTHVYREFGTYNVVLNAFDESGNKSVYSSDIIVGQRYFTQIHLTSSLHDLPFQLFFYIGEVGNPNNTYYLQFPAIWLSIHGLPFGGNVDFGEDVLLSNKDWYWGLIENRQPLEMFDENDVLIFGTVLNPSNVLPGSLIDNEGLFSILETRNVHGELTYDYQMLVGYTLK